MSEADSHKSGTTCSATSLTGRTRHRLQGRLFRTPLLVLQVEFRWAGMPGGSRRVCDGLSWRDATFNDLPVAAGIGGCG